MTDSQTYVPLGGSPIRCYRCPGAAAFGVARLTIGQMPVCRICATSLPGPLVAPLMAETMVFAQSLIDDLVEVLMDDGALAEMLLDWEVNGGGPEEGVDC